MSLVSAANVSLEEKKSALNRALDERTDPIRLRQCVIDLCSYGLCAESWWENQWLPRLYAISVSYNETTTDI